MKTSFIILTILILISSVSVFVFFLNNGIRESTANHKIVLTEDGFKPDNIAIKKGESIEFSTTTGNPFWPASNLHPTHGIYSEFDPKDAIMPDKTWTFKFNKVGEWKFHDHLAPYFIGTIKVNEE